jgi:sugar fermentation stimulation protein A
LLELARLAREGTTSAVLFCVQRSDATVFAPASSIDPLYARTLSEMQEHGVQVLAYQADVNPEEIRLARKIPLFTEP